MGEGKRGVATMKREEIIKTLEVIKKSNELVFEHYKSRGFRNSLIEVEIQNIIRAARLIFHHNLKSLWFWILLWPLISG